MATVEAVGLIATGVTLIYLGLGLPAQIIKNYKGKSVEGLSKFLYIALFLTAVSWITYAILKPDYYILVSNIPGVIAGGIILIQFCLPSYSKKGRGKT